MALAIWSRTLKIHSATRQPRRAGKLRIEQLEARLLLCAEHLGKGNPHANPELGTFPVIQDGLIAAEASSSSAAATYPLSSIPVLNSLPGAAASLYLDFDGHFDATWGSYTNVTTPVFDQDNDVTTFSDGELTNIQGIWQRVAEDYAPFKINVTTVQPASFANKVAMRVAIGGDGLWSGGTYGGVAYVGSFTSSIANTVYVFPKNLSNGNARYTAEASSHESGHSFGLQHQSQYASGVKIEEYYAGSGDGRAPIMGSSYYAARGLWWYGTSSTGSTVYQDDMAVISNTTNGFGYRADDIPAATPLTSSASDPREVSGAGLIEKVTDQDAFSFTAAAGEMNLAVNVASGVGNLNARLELRSGSGTLLAASDPANFDLRRSITYAGAGGNYQLVVASHGGYGDVGQYTLSGTIPVLSTIGTPTNLTATPITTTQIDLNWVDNAGNEDGYYVDRSATGGQTWTRHATLSADSHSFSDVTVGGSTYHYRVSAFINDGDVSAHSNQASATTVPTAPWSLTAAALWSDSIELAWANVAGETGYYLERSSDGGNVWSPPIALGANIAKYRDSGLLAATNYTYRVWATNATGNSAFSNLASATTFAAAPTAFGSQDGTFIVESWSGTYYDLKIQPADQKILAAGSKYSTDPAAASDHRMAIARYLSSGSDDTTYGTGGLAAPALGSSIEYGNALALQPDGKAIVAGLVNSTFGAARFTSNGAVDTSFGSGGSTSIDVRPDDFYSPANAVALQSTGKIVIAGGTLSTSTTVEPAALARLTTSGALDSGKKGFGKVAQGQAPGYTLATFGGEFNDFYDIVTQADNKIVVVGRSPANGGLIVARYTADGVLDTTFNGSGSSVFLPPGFTSAGAGGVTLQADGKIILVGSISGGGSSGMLVARYHASGTNSGKLDTTFGGGAGFVRLDTDGVASTTAEGGSEVVIQPDGKIVVVGSRTVAGGVSDVLVARLNANGTLDSAFGAGGFKFGTLPSELGPHRGLFGTSIALLSNGNLIVSGYGSWAPAGSSGLQYYHPLLMRFSGTSLPPVGPAASPTVGSPLGPIAATGWFIDAQLAEDSEFTTPGDQGEQHRKELLTVVMHELGHMLGRGHDADGVMAETLAAGVRESDLEQNDATLADEIFSLPGDTWQGAWLTEYLDSTRSSKRRG